MSDIMLSRAVRSNLLSLQNTADLMSRTQERLATGLKVNSALDNPTNFFTSQGLNARANDLSRLLDGIGNATQTLAAADNGIRAITKLVESAQATARQALQTSATVQQTTPGTAGTLTAGAFTTVDVSAAGGPATAGAITAGAFSAVDLSETGSVAQAAVFTSPAAFAGPLDLDGNSISFDIAVDGEVVPQNIEIDAAAIIAFNADPDNALNQKDGSALTAQDVVDLINAQLTGATASLNGDGEIVFTSGTTGDDSSIEITNYDATDVLGGTTGIANTGAVITGQDAVPAASITFDLTVDGVTTNVELTAATVAAFDNTFDLSNLSAANIAAVINDQVGSNVATVGGGGNLVFTSGTTGEDSTVAIANFNASGTAGGSTGVADTAEVSGDAAGTGASISFDLSRNGGPAQTITINATTVAAFDNTLDASNLSAANVAAIINSQFGATVASVNDDGQISFSGSGTGTTSTVTVSNFASVGGVDGDTGIANGTGAGEAAQTEGAVNPRRAEFVQQYNDLMSQIDDLARDASFNGVNLLNGDTLSVIFNEDGSSRLTIEGVEFDSGGLGLNEIDADAFNSDASINDVLGELDIAIGSLRSQASKFGSNLSVVQTRQDFTKRMIDTLQTGASNLTLADTNLEGANLLALQTRQQLSSTALSLASQADQNVLRLF